MDLGGSDSGASTLDEGHIRKPGSKRNRGLLSCTECHRRKQKCNRHQPCNDCILRKVPWKCQFRAPLPPKRKRRKSWKSPIGFDLVFSDSMVAESPKQNAVSMVDHYFSSDPDGPSLIFNDLGSYLDPFTYLPHTPGWLPKAQLLHHFNQRIAPWMSENIMPDLQPQTPRICWLPEAVHDPALLYATFLAAAVHMNRMVRNRYLNLAIWIKIETLRLLNDNLWRANDEALLSILIMLFFTIDGNDFTEYETHLRGINQMVKLRGGVQNLGIRGQLTTWLAYYCHGPWSPDWEDGHFRYLCDFRP